MENNKLVWWWFWIIVAVVLALAVIVWQGIKSKEPALPAPTYKIGNEPAAEVDTLSEQKEAIEDKLDALEK